ncbi:SDR2b [Symbiodinium sp. CCMP2592]|nr:SDR2b [Symbiodinium sp. CCMP2592]
MKRVVVTGGNSGIGLALCKQLAQEDGCYVYLGSRNVEKGEKALASIVSSAPECKGKVEVLQVDTASDESVAKAAEAVKASLPAGESLYGVVNNAGTGLQHGTTGAEIMNVNFYGPKRMVEAFLPLLSPSDGRIVNVGSGAGPMYVKAALSSDTERARMLCSCPESFDPLEALAKSELARKEFLEDRSASGPYGCSKALLSAYSQLLGKLHPNILSSCCTPGFIDTAIVKGWGATKTPEEGTVSIRHCLLKPLEGNGYYYGSDGIRSPYHFMRNPGEPVYDGKIPF